MLLAAISKFLLLFLIFVKRGFFENLIINVKNRLKELGNRSEMLTFVNRPPTREKLLLSCKSCLARIKY